jgi:5-methylcytosine-specific restriction protein A
MPAALLRPCGPHCPVLVRSGRCAEHRRAAEQRRGSASRRGYGRFWERFRVWFISLLVSAGSAPVCGASLPGGPDTRRFSQCAQRGVLNDVDLHVDHEPPLTDEERTDRAKVCDPLRVGLLCASCHATKTAGEDGGFGNVRWKAAAR